MKTYYITSEFIYHTSTEIEAESEEEAKEIWEQMSMKQIVGYDYVSLGELEDGLIVGVYEGE